MHEALLYGDDDAYLDGTIPFIEAGLSAGEPVLVAVPAKGLELLHPWARRAGTDLVRLTSMEEMGRNPAWIIPAWADFVAAHPGRRLRGVGEPIWDGRSDDELVECERHETLLNLALADADLTLLCPYDTSKLDPSVIDGAHRNHPHIGESGGSSPSEHFRADIAAALDAPLPPSPQRAQVILFDSASLGRTRERTAEEAAAAGLPPTRIEDVVVAVSEAVTNSIRHGGGFGQLAHWRDGSRFVCEVRDHGRITDPLAGRLAPDLDAIGGRGLWLMHQLCDLVQIRSFPGGQVIRLHIKM